MRCWSCFRCARARRLPRKCSSTTSTAGWTNRNSRSSTCSYASCARSCRLLAAAPITSRRCGAAAMFCERPMKPKSRSRKRPSRNDSPQGQRREGGAERLRLFLCLDQHALAFAADRQDQWLVHREFGLAIVHPRPAVAAEPLEGSEARLVGHPVGPIDPITEINVRQPRTRGADDMVEDDVGAEAFPHVRTNVEE